MQRIQNPLKAFSTRALFTVTILFSTQALPVETVTYYHNDLLGSPIAATHTEGSILWRKVYRPYGSELDNGGEAADGNAIGYTGHRFDKDLSLIYAGARYYDSEIGRFMGMDPVGFQEDSVHTFNKYAYANNNPHRYVDPDGREIVSVNPANNAQLGSYINNLASGIFRFNNKNQLEMVSSTGGTGKSQSYTDQLKKAIDHRNIITLDIITSPGASIKDVVTYSHSNGFSEVTITNATYMLRGMGDSLVPGTPDTNLAHELVEHAIPNQQGRPRGNTMPTFQENKIRRDNNLPRRSGLDHF